MKMKIFNTKIFNLSHLILDSAEQSLFISTNKTIAGIPSTNTNIEFVYNLIENNIGVCKSFRYLDKIYMVSS